MEKLPPTSYIRMVDIWLIFGQIIPFLQVGLLTIQEFYNDSETINHHGYTRPVKELTSQMDKAATSSKPTSKHIIEKAWNNKAKKLASNQASTV